MSLRLGLDCREDSDDSALTKGYRKGVEVAILVFYSLILSKHYIQMFHIKPYDYS
jgi:hypothetical protein